MMLSTASLAPIFPLLSLPLAGVGVCVVFDVDAIAGRICAGMLFGFGWGCNGLLSDLSENLCVPRRSSCSALIPVFRAADLQTRLGSRVRRSVVVAGDIKFLSVHGPISDILPASFPMLWMCGGRLAGMSMPMDSCGNLLSGMETLRFPMVPTMYCEVPIVVSISASYVEFIAPLTFLMPFHAAPST